MKKSALVMAEVADWKKGDQVKGEDQGPELCSVGERREESPYGGVDIGIGIA